MPVLGMFIGSFCADDSFLESLIKDIGYAVILDDDVVAKAEKSCGISGRKLQRAFSGAPSLFNPFTFEKERSIAFLRHSLAEMVADDGCIVHGFCAHLLPAGVSHILRVCLIAQRKSRAGIAVTQEKIREDEAMKLVRQDDEDRSAWVESVRGVSDPWEASLYDMVFPVDRLSRETVLNAIEGSLNNEILRPTKESIQAMHDFRLAARVDAALAKEGHNLQVTASSGEITLTINRQVLLLERLEEELRRIASRIEGVDAIRVVVEKDDRAADLYRKYDPGTPSKVLLVDDEREFVQTLSDRLIMREMGSVVAYDGESALEMVEADEPEVMILDLKMPGIDGIEVLKRIKESRPDIQVIILTGRGTRADRDICMQLGAFAYLEKPVDIELLSEALRMANEKVRRTDKGRRDPEKESVEKAS